MDCTGAGNAGSSWIGTKVSAEACMAGVLGRADCQRSFFKWAKLGDHNCAHQAVAMNVNDGTFQEYWLWRLNVHHLGGCRSRCEGCDGLHWSWQRRTSWIGTKGSAEACMDAAFERADCKNVNDGTLQTYLFRRLNVHHLGGCKSRCEGWDGLH